MTDQPPPAQPPGGYPAQPRGGYPVQQPPPKKKSKAGLIAGILGITAFLCCGGFSAWALATADERAKEVGGGTPTVGVSPTPTREKDGAAKAKVGECINVYSLPAPSPATPPATPTSQVVSASERVPCAPGSYEVLKRIGATTDGNACSTVTGATSQYVADQSLSKSEDFVLCLKQR